MGVFNENLEYYLDEQRKSVDDDPTLQPWIDTIQREAHEDYQKSTYNLHDQAARSGLLGGGYYQGMVVGANEEFNEALQGQLASIYMGRFNQAEQNELAALGLLNQRDMNKAQVAGQIKSARIGASASLAGVNLAREQWMANQPYTDMERTINIMNGLNDLGGFTDNGAFIPQPAPYTGPSGGAAALLGALGGGMQGYGAAYDWGMTKKAATTR